MTAKQAVKNIGSEDGKSVTWVGDDGLVHIRIARVVVAEEINQLIEKVKGILEEFSGKEKILVDMGHISDVMGVSSSSFRKKSAGQIKGLIKDPGFKRAAIFGGNIMHRTIASFIIVASGQKNIKIFEKEKEALKWLKEP